MSVAPQDILGIDSTPEDEIVWLSYLIEDEPGPTDLPRSEANIRAWLSYLPEDCVEMMVKMGWHNST